MITNYRLFNVISPFIVYTLAFYCLASTNMFDFSGNGRNASIITSIIINAIAVLILVIARIENVYYTSSIISLIFLVLPVISVSKLNWFKTVFGMNVKSNNFTGIIALSSYLAFLELIISINSRKQNKWKDQQKLNGVEEAEYLEAFEKHRTVLAYLAIAVTLVSALIIIFGFFLFDSIKIKLEPMIFLAAGAAVAAISLIFYGVSAYKKK